MLPCCSPCSTEDDESDYDTYAEVEEDSRIGDRCSHRGARPAHPPVHNVQGLLTFECKLGTKKLFPGASVAKRRQMFDHQDEGEERQPRRKPISRGRNQGQRNFVP